MQPTPQTPEGARVAISTNDFATTVTNLTDAITANPNLGLVKTVDHQAGAASRDLTLLPTTEVFFGNPRLGTPLMQSAQTTHSLAWLQLQPAPPLWLTLQPLPPPNSRD